MEKGRLVIPLTAYPALDNKSTVFIPSGGPEGLGGFFEKLPVDQLFPFDTFPISSVPLTKKLTNIRIDTKFEFFNAPRGEILEGDVLNYCGRDYYQVDNVGKDNFQPWVDLVSIGKRNQFCKNNIKRPLKFGSIPKIIGKIVHLDSKDLSPYHRVDLHFKTRRNFHMALAHLVI